MQRWRQLPSVLSRQSLSRPRSVLVVAAASSRRMTQPHLMRTKPLQGAKVPVTTRVVPGVATGDVLYIAGDGVQGPVGKTDGVLSWQ